MRIQKIDERILEIETETRDQENGLRRIRVRLERNDVLVPLPRRVERTRELIAAVGLGGVGAPHVRHLTGPLWEMRLRGKGGISRALDVTVRDRRVVVVRAFVKKTPKTPRREIDLALRRAAEVLQ